MLCKKFGEIVRSLHELTKKNGRFECSTSSQMALTGVSDSPFIVGTYANNISIGAILSNFIDGVEHPTVFARRSLSKADPIYNTAKREALAVVQALKWFNLFIWGLSFVIRTDHASLKWLFRRNKGGLKLRMLQHLQEFNNKIVPADKKHANADGFSRITDEEPERESAEIEQVTWQFPKSQELEVALKKVHEQCTMVDAITETTGDKKEAVAIT